MRVSGGGDRRVRAAGPVLAARQHPRTPGQPAIFNTDPGSRFTRDAFTGVLLDAGIAISMDGRGRARDNLCVARRWRGVKYEDVYLKGYITLPAPLRGLTTYFAFHNGARPHQGLGNRTPEAVPRAGKGGGAGIADRHTAPRRCNGCHPCNLN